MTPVPCRLCSSRGQQHDPNPARCQGHSTQHQRQCEQRPLAGMRVCGTHGGRSRNAKAGRDKRQAAARIKAEAARHVTYGRLVDVSPTEALLEEVKWTAGHVAYLRAEVQKLEAAALSWGKSEEARKNATEFAGVDETFKAAPPVLVELYQRERKHLVETCAAAVRAGVEERLVALAQAQGDLLGPWLVWLVEQSVAFLAVPMDDGRWDGLRVLVRQLIAGIGDGTVPPARPAIEGRTA